MTKIFNMGVNNIFFSNYTNVAKERVCGAFSVLFIY